MGGSAGAGGEEEYSLAGGDERVEISSHFSHPFFNMFIVSCIYY
jgi:hypothetical protein